MQEPQVNETISQLRVSNRKNLLGLRKGNREALLKQRRLSLCEVEALVTTISLQQFNDLILKVKHKKATVETLKAIKNNCCTPDRSQDFFRFDGALDALIRILIGRDAEMQLEAIACLTNLACGSHKASNRIARAAGPYLVSFISSGNCYLQDQCSWAAGNMASDCFECYSLLKSQGLVPALLAVLKSSSSDAIQSSVFALNVSTKYGDLDLRELFDPDTIDSLLKIINQETFSNSIHSDAAFVLSNIYYLTAASNTETDIIVFEPIIHSLCKVISESEMNIPVALPLIRCLGFMSKHASVCLGLSQSSSFLHLLRQVLQSECHSLRKEGLWIMCNIAVSVEVHESIVDFNLLGELLATNQCLQDLSLQVLYFLCTLAIKSEKIRTQIKCNELFAKVNTLLNCGDAVVENACKIFFSVVQ